MTKQNLVLMVFVACFLGMDSVARDKINGFDVSNASVPVKEIYSGGPPKDGIPAIDHPVFLDARNAKFMAESARVIGVSRHGYAKAYPISILNWHEIVNDIIGSEPIVISYCPLCGTGMVFAANDALTFGVSGLLYNSDVLMYDRQSESLWSQLKMEAISGRHLGQKLDLLPASHTTWSDWLSRYPTTKVLSEPTGFHREYDRDPYAEYSLSSRLFFPVSSLDHRYHPKEQVIGVTIGDRAWAWPFAELSLSSGIVKDEVAGHKVEVHYDSVARTGRVIKEGGQEIPSTIAYWFAWMSFYPASQVYNAP
jgi:hypothetical protein